MRTGERVVLYSLVVVALLCSLRLGLSGGANALAADPGDAKTLAIPAGQTASTAGPTRLGTCDMLDLLEVLISQEKYFSPRKSAEDRLKAPLAPLEATLTTLRAELQGADPNKAENQAKSRDYRVKVEEYNQLRAQAAEAFQKFVASQFSDGFEQIRQVVAEVAKKRGYTHVAMSRKGKITAQDPGKIAEDFLSRPYAVFPEEDDVTEEVRAILGLPEKSTNPSAQPGAVKMPEMNAPKK